MNFTKTHIAMMPHVNIDYYDEGLITESVDDGFGDTLVIQISDGIDQNIWNCLYDKLEAMGAIDELY
jgi:hypothetical protein